MTIYENDVVLSEKICNILLQYGINPNLKNKQGWAPLHIIIKKGQIEAFQYILNYNSEL